MGKLKRGWGLIFMMIYPLFSPPSFSLVRGRMESLDNKGIRHETLNLFVREIWAAFATLGSVKSLIPTQSGWFEVLVLVVDSQIETRVD